MRIALDATRINIPDGGGTYTREVIKSLLGLGSDDTFHLLVPEVVEEFSLPNVNQILYPEVDGVRTRLRYAVGVSGILRRENIDVFHNLTNYGIYRSPCPVVTTVHDLLTFKFPHLRSSRLQWLLYKYYLPGLLRRADAVVAVSDNTKRDLADLYGIATNVEVVYEGFDEDTFRPQPANDADILAKFGIEPGYLLFVGYLTPKKNVEVILHSLAILRDEYRLQPKLVLVGETGHGAEKISRLVAELNLQPQLVKTGFVAVQELAAIYRQAGLFLFPSYYEGFGLPVLEAMASGCPVLVADAGSLPELVTSPDRRCEPSDLQGWVDRVRAILSDQRLRENSRAWSIERSKAFSWSTCALQIRSIYDRLVGTSS